MPATEEKLSAKAPGRAGKTKPKPKTARKSSAATAAATVKPGLGVMTRIDDKTAVVSGAAQGIGRGIALQLSQSGTARTVRQSPPLPTRLSMWGHTVVLCCV